MVLLAVAEASNLTKAADVFASFTSGMLASISTAIIQVRVAARPYLIRNCAGSSRHHIAAADDTARNQHRSKIPKRMAYARRSESSCVLTLFLLARLS
jgi:hypothetical protein